MSSPFPGMDPYLEGHLWPDLHATLAARIRQRLAPLVRPKYVVRLEVSVVEDKAPEEEIGVMYPDVEVLRDASRRDLPATTQAGQPTPATLTVPIPSPIKVKLISVHIEDAVGNQLVTSIEILSPVNKHEPGAGEYQLKRQRIIEAGVHLAELDLLRRGKRPIKHLRLQTAAYLVALTRAGHKHTDLWLLSLRDPLPSIPIPLLPPDEDVVLNLQALLNDCYDEAIYDLSINYTLEPPPPVLSEEDRAFLQQVLRQSS